MDELKRYIKDQGDRQLQEQQRIMERSAQFNTQYDDSEDCTSESAEFDEKTVEETVFFEETVFEEETVL